MVIVGNLKHCKLLFHTLKLEFYNSILQVKKEPLEPASKNTCKKDNNDNVQQQNMHQLFEAIELWYVKKKT